MKILIITAEDRSMGPMAAALLREVSGAEVISAGLEAIPGMPVFPKAAHAMGQKYRLDLTANRARRMERALGEEADLILCMTAADGWRVRTLYPETRDRLSLFYGYARGLKGVYYDLPCEQAPPEELSHYMACAENLAQAVQKINLQLQRNERKEETL